MIVESIAGAKAYEVPAICSLVGLAHGETDEAFQSKAQYVRSRLVALSSDQVLNVAKKLTDEDYATNELKTFVRSSAVVQVGERLTVVTRKRLLAVFERLPLTSGQVEDDLELLSRVRNLETKAPDGTRFRTLREYLANDMFDSLGAADALTVCGFMTWPTANVAKFLEEAVSPEFRTDPQVQALMLNQLNSALAGDDLQLQAEGKLSGSPTYRLRLNGSRTPSDPFISASLAAFDAGSVAKRWEAALARRSDDPAGAITLARTLLEDVCKWGLARLKMEWQDSDDLPALYKPLAKKLRLSTDDHTDPVFRSLLGSCQNIVTKLGELRNKAGDAHSSGPKRGKPALRHAELAVNLAGTMAQFLVATIERYQSENSRES